MPKGSRVKDIMDMLAGGASEAQILHDIPNLEAADIRASLQYAARQGRPPDDGLS
jgi:uncharacterized protein (DUF433 family)